MLYIFSGLLTRYCALAYYGNVDGGNEIDYSNNYDYQVGENVGVGFAYLLIPITLASTVYVHAPSSELRHQLVTIPSFNF